MFAVLLSMTACQSVPGKGTDALSGTHWRLAEWSGGPVGPSRFKISANFDKGELSGKSAVNAYGGAYHVSGKDGITFGEIQSTLMGADDEAMRAESAYFDLLRKTRKFSINSGVLSLKDVDGRAIMRFQAVTP
jgi:heat shock protein HslJ